MRKARPGRVSVLGGGTIRKDEKTYKGGPSFRNLAELSALAVGVRQDDVEVLAVKVVDNLSLLRMVESRKREGQPQEWRERNGQNVPKRRVLLQR